MTANNSTNTPAAPAAATATSSRVSPTDIEQVDAFARRLYKRVRAAGPDLEEISEAVRNLHTVLKHLKFEAEDPESLLSVDNSAVYSRQLTPILEDSEFALKQLDTILEKYGGSIGGTDGEGVGGGMQMDGEKGWTVLDSRERDTVDLIRAKLAKQKLSIDLFLDTIQLHNPAKSRRMIDTDSADLESIKDKVDAIASRIFQRRNSNLGDSNEEELWERFRDELERAGFSRDVLRKNQDVIRAYIRQLDDQLGANGGNTPSVRGLLEHYHPRGDGRLQIAPYPTYTGPDGLSPVGFQPNIDEEKLFPSRRMKRLDDEYGENDHNKNRNSNDDDDNNNNSNKNNNRSNNISTNASKPPAPQPPSMPNHPTHISYDHHSSSGDDDDESMALMSTRELMALDKRAADLALAMGNMHLLPPTLPSDSAAMSYHMSSSPSASRPTLPSSVPQVTGDESGTYPRHLSSFPSIGDGSQPTRLFSSTSVAEVSQQQQALAASSQRSARLAPDSKGHEIPLDARWTRIPRRLVSPEVLAGAGVRYEARPDFVAILGELDREEVARLARRTTEVRAARRRRPSTAPGPAITTGGDNTKGRRAEDTYHPDKYRNWDVVDTERQRRQRQKEDDRNSRDTDYDDNDGGVTYIVNSSSRRRRGSMTSTASELYDSSDGETSDTDTDSDDRDRGIHGVPSSYSQSYPRSGSHLDNYQHSFPETHRRSSTFPSAPSNNNEKARARARGRADSEVTEGLGSDDDSYSGEKGSKAYPSIVPQPSSADRKDKDASAGVSPATTVKPRPILKNKNDEPHVRIDPHPQIIDEGSSSVPRSLPSYRRSERERRDRDRDRGKDRDRDRSRDRERDRERDRDRDHDREKRYRSDRYSDRERERERHPDRDRDRDKGEHRRDKEYHSHRDRDDGREEYPNRHRHRSRSHRYHSSGAPRREREREYYDDHCAGSSNRLREDRASRKKARDETLRAVGLGGAAAAMLSMLSEATM